MRKQTKLVAVLSTAALLAIGASMTSFAAGWTEEDGTWVYYDNDNERVTNEWRRSGNNWFWLNDDGEMAVDELIEDDDDFYYVNESGAMVSNQWVAIENEDAGEEDEPEYWWYYFQANGKAYKDSGNSDNASWKLINGKYYTFDEDGQMQYGWITRDGERQTGDDDWKQGEGAGSDNAMYYCGDENDGARTSGWRLINIYDEDWNPDEYQNGDIYDEDQERWFWFKSNGQRVQSDDKTIDGRKYMFDEYGRMLPLWVAYNTGDITASVSTTAPATTAYANRDFSDRYNIIKDGYFGADPISKRSDEGGQGDEEYSTEWRYFGDPEDGARVSKGWFRVVPSQYLDADKYDDSEDYWYYSDNSGYLYANVIKSIDGKKYAFDSYGRMITGLNILRVKGGNRNTIVDVYNKDAFDTEDKFDTFYNAIRTEVEEEGDDVYVYYFNENGGSVEGQMMTGTQTIDIDGDDLTFEFEKNGSRKGQGKNGYDNDSKKCYIGGKVTKADSDEKYEIVLVYEGDWVEQYSLSELTDKFDEKLKFADWNEENKNDKTGEYLALEAGENQDVEDFFNEDGECIADFTDSDVYKAFSLKDTLNNGVEKGSGSYIEAIYVVNTSGVVQDNKKCKNGDDYYIVSSKRSVGDVYSVYSED